MDGVCIPTDELTGSGGGGGSAGGSAASAGAAGEVERIWTGCPVDAPGSPMVEAHMPDGTPYCIDVRPANEADYDAFIDADPAVEGLPPEQCSELDTFTLGPFMSSIGVVLIDWCSAYAYCAWSGRRLCGRVEGNGGGVNDSEWYNACSDGGAHAYAWGDDYREQCVYAYEYLPECASEPYGLVGIGEPPNEWTGDCGPMVESDGTESVGCTAFNHPSLHEESTCDVTELLPGSWTANWRAGVRCCF